MSNRRCLTDPCRHFFHRSRNLTALLCTAVKKGNFYKLLRLSPCSVFHTFFPLDARPKTTAEAADGVPCRMDDGTRLTDGMTQRNIFFAFDFLCKRMAG